jgi:hypothetical protein
MTTTPATTSGIFLSDDFLVNDELSLEAKIIYLLIKRELETTHKHFTPALTDPRLSKMTGLSKSSVQRKLQELKKKGYIALVSLNRAVARNERGLPSAIKGIRYIYLDRRLAGYRRRAINKKKLPIALSYRLLVLDGYMTPQAYLKMMRREHQKLMEDEERREQEQYQEALAEFHSKLTDDELAKLEKLDNVPPDTYVKQKRDYLESQKELVGNDDPFGDADFKPVV